MRTAKKLLALNMALLLSALLLSGAALAITAELREGEPLQYTESTEVSSFTFIPQETGWYTFTIRAVASCGTLSLYRDSEQVDGLVYTRSLDEANENLTVYLTAGEIYTLHHTPKVKNLPQYTVEANRVRFTDLESGISTPFTAGANDYTFFRFTPQVSGWYTLSTSAAGIMTWLEGDLSPINTGYIGCSDYFTAGETLSFAFRTSAGGSFAMTATPSHPAQLSLTAPLTLAIDRGCVTYVRFVPAETAKYTFTAESDLSNGIRGIRIRNESGDLLSGGTAGTGFATVSQTAELAEGETYYVGVTGGARGSCTLGVSRGQVVRSYTVTFESDGGTQVPQQLVREGRQCTEPLAPEKAGWIFTGWYYAGTDTLYDFTQPVSGSLTLTAHWEQVPSDLLVSFRSEGGTAVASQTVGYGEKAAEPEPPTRDGYEFAGWLLNGETYSFDTPVTEDLVLTASWEAKRSFTVTFDAAGGDPVEAQTVLSGGTAREETAKRSGYRFQGWYLEDRKYDFTTPVTKDLTLTAKWTSMTGAYVAMGLGGAALAGGAALVIARVKRRRKE